MEKQTTTEEKKKLSIREFFTLGEVGGYFFRSGWIFLPKKRPIAPIQHQHQNDAWDQ